MAGEIISERRATSNRNGGRDHPGIPGDFPRNPQKVVVTTAIAREMVGFIWAIARVAQPPLEA
jgi:hypothetical protein